MASTRPTRIATDQTATDLRQLAESELPSVAIPLRAIANLLDGMTREEAAGDVGASTHGVSRWVKIFREKGVEGLRSRRQRRLIRKDLSADELRRLAGTVDPRTRRRLFAMADLVEGMQQRDVAKRYRTGHNTIPRWLARYNRLGVDGLVEAWKGSFEMQEPVQIRDDIPAEDVWTASTQTEGRAAVRIAAIAHVLEGIAPATAARSVGANPDVIGAWIKRFNAEGIEGLRNHRPRALRVTLRIRRDISSIELRQVSLNASDSARKRLLGIADVLDGHGRLETTKKYSVGPSTMTNWIHRFNQSGIHGLLNSR